MRMKRGKERGLPESIIQLKPFRGRALSHPRGSPRFTGPRFYTPGPVRYHTCCRCRLRRENGKSNGKLSFLKWYQGAQESRSNVDIGNSNTTTSRSTEITAWNFFLTCNFFQSEFKLVKYFTCTIILLHHSWSGRHHVLPHKAYKNHFLVFQVSSNWFPSSVHVTSAVYTDNSKHLSNGVGS